VGAELAELADDSIFVAEMGCLPLLFAEGSARSFSCCGFSRLGRGPPAVPERARDCSICVSRSVALGSSRWPGVFGGFAKGSESSDSSPSSSTLLKFGFFCWKGGGRRNI
jgi:hypothetical protein